MRRLLSLLVLLLLLVACGGNAADEPAADTGSANTGDTADTSANDGADEVDAEADTSTEAAAEEAAEDETAAEEEVAAEDEAAEEEPAAENETPEEEAAAEEEAMDDTGGELQMSGIDPETGLEINPDPIPKGVEFIAIGEAIQMNLTPQDSPEFVIRGPNGVNYRIATQALSEIFTLEGATLLPHEYKINMLAKATAFLPADAALSDVLTSDDFTIISLP